MSKIEWRGDTVSIVNGSNTHKTLTFQAWPVSRIQVPVIDSSQ